MATAAGEAENRDAKMGDLELNEYAAGEVDWIVFLMAEKVFGRSKLPGAGESEE